MKAVGWVFVNTIQALYTAFWTLLWVPVALLVLVVTFNRRYPLAMARHIWAAGMIWGARAKLEISGLENVDFSKPHVFVCNHQSMIDIPILFNVIPANLHFVLKKELLYVPLIGAYAWAMGMIFVDRKQQSLTLSSVRKIGRLVRMGRSVVAFPEGTRSRGRGIRPFKRGVFFAASEAGVAIVPMALEGADRVLPSDHFAIRPGVVRISLGKPVQTSNLTSQQRLELPETMRKVVLQLYEGIKYSGELSR